MGSLIQRRKAVSKPGEKVLPSLYRLWMLRMLVLGGGQSNFIISNGFCNDAVADALGVSHLAEDPEDDFSASAARAELKRLLGESERKTGRRSIPPLLSTNAKRLGALVGLDEVARDVLCFIILIKTDLLLNETSDLMGQMTTLRAIQTIAIVTGIAEDTVKSALSPDGALLKSGILRIDRSSSYHLDNKFAVLSDEFADSMFSDDRDALHLLRHAVRPAPAGALRSSDYAHLGDTVPMIEACLRDALASGRKGVNILIYGPPGTGKSELARLLAREIGIDLMEVVSGDGDGDPIEGERRLNAFRAAQWIFAERPALILFDEIEDVFNDTSPFSTRRSVGQTRKGWVNAMLEQNPVPTLWLSNSVSCLDHAFIRRFDVVAKIPVPPREQRKAIITGACGAMLPAVAIDRFANAEHLPPAVMTRAADVARTIARTNPALQAERVLEKLVDGTLQAQGYDAVSRLANRQLPATYDPAFINTDADLVSIAAGLKASGTGRICLYGPPGTGKTAYGHWLAGQLGKPLVVKRGSDLLSMWLGGTEKAIAAAFAEAGDDDAILMIDEVDSFLQDRRGATRSWEVTQVNELLTQMESFDGVLVASTNLMDGMDQAALRRFDVKARFDYLSRAQSIGLLQRHCTDSGLPEPSDADVATLRSLDVLTPGDFAAIARRQRFQPLHSASAWVAALAAECSFKEAGRPRIGFGGGRH